MRRCVSGGGLAALCLVACACGAAFAEGTDAPEPAPAGPVYTSPVRNPFWPIGYRGSFEAISDGSAEAEAGTKADADAIRRAELAAANVGADDPLAAARENARRWRNARRAIRVGVVTESRDDRGRKVRYISVGGYSYQVGDVLTVERENWRFAWLIEGFDDVGEMTLRRIGAVELQPPATDEEDEDGFPSAE